jgi:hypothetical protein
MTVYRPLMVVVFACTLLAVSAVAKPGIKTPDAKPAIKTEAVDNTPAHAVTSIELVKQPEAYLNKKVSFKATFNSFASLGLDYKKAFRDSKDYVSVLVLRPDVNPKYRIPLSELKLFFPRKKSDVVMHLDAGDTIKVTGTVFSNALGEPWMDIDQLVITDKAPKAEGKLGEAPRPDPLKPETKPLEVAPDKP